jgi:hypothetical protein
MERLKIETHLIPASLLATCGPGARHLPLRAWTLIPRAPGQLLGALLGSAHVPGSATPSVLAPEHDNY